MRSTRSPSELAKRGHRVIGVEPSGAMLALARCRRCSEQAEWIEGDALRLGEIGGEVGADLAIMPSHVAQIIRDDEVWPATLAAVREALGPNGRVAFESRNALAREWTPQASREELVSHTELKFRTRTELSRSLSMPASRWRASSATGTVARPTQRAAN
jgi:hypothetical protein